MRVFTDKGEIIRLDNLQFSKWVFEILQRLQYHCPSLRLEGVNFETQQKVRVCLMQLDLDWMKCLMLNSGC
ncbi:MAG: hypothetical protein WC763_05285 [Candidatus Paceibacterota bacterium]|jgi:hypothetical protein